MEQRTWRIAHRRIGWVAALFLAWAGATGAAMAAVEFFGADEAERERLRESTSPVTTAAEEVAWAEPVRRAFAAVAALAPAAPVDKVEIVWKATVPAVHVFTGLPGGGEDREFVFDARSGALLEQVPYRDKPLLHRLHSGEAFGDGGLVVAMAWGLALVFLSSSGVVLYLHMRRPGATGWRRWFW